LFIFSDTSSTSPPPTRKADAPPPPVTNAWAERRERQESRPTQIERAPQYDERAPQYDEDERQDPSLTPAIDRYDQHSPHPDSDHKDTNSEPEDERDLRLQQEDDFQRVERRGRKPKPVTPIEPNNRPRGEVSRGTGSYARGTGGRGVRRGTH